MVCRPEERKGNNRLHDHRNTARGREKWGRARICAEVGVGLLTSTFLHPPDKNNLRIEEGQRSSMLRFSGGCCESHERPILPPASAGRPSNRPPQIARLSPAGELRVGARD
jgi:hypothetical protein